MDLAFNGNHGAPRAAPGVPTVISPLVMLPKTVSVLAGLSGFRFITGRIPPASAIEGDCTKLLEATIAPALILSFAPSFTTRAARLPALGLSRKHWLSLN